MSFYFEFLLMFVAGAVLAAYFTGTAQEGVNPMLASFAIFYVCYQHLDLHTGSMVNIGPLGIITLIASFVTGVVAAVRHHLKETPNAKR